MRVLQKDGVCRTCAGQLRITDADEETMTVECDVCGDVYAVETDAFGDGCMVYYMAFIAGRETAGE